MPVDHAPESADHAGDPEMVVAPVGADAILAAVLAALVEPLARHVAQTLTIDRMPNVPGSTPVPIAERARACADVAISDVAHELRQLGYRPKRGERLVRQHAARLAETVVRRYLLSLEVSPASADVACGMLWNEEVSSDKFRAASQLAAYHEKVDPPPLEPVEIPRVEGPDHA